MQQRCVMHLQHADLYHTPDTAGMSEEPTTRKFALGDLVMRTERSFNVYRVCGTRTDSGDHQISLVRMSGGFEEDSKLVGLGQRGTSDLWYTERGFTKYDHPTASDSAH